MASFNADMLISNADMLDGNAAKLDGNTAKLDEICNLLKERPQEQLLRLLAQEDALCAAPEKAEELRTALEGALRRLAPAPPHPAIERSPPARALAPARP